MAVARALATGPKALLCDEPTSAVDPRTTSSVLQYLADPNAEFGITIVVVTHEMNVIKAIADNVAVTVAMPALPGRPWPDRLVPWTLPPSARSA